MLRTTTAAILAGGRARRFGGRDKSRLVVNGHTIIVRQLGILQRVAADVFVVSDDAPRFADLAVPVYPDTIPGAGAIGGILTALEQAASPLVLVVACDQPFLSEALLNALVDRVQAHDGAWVHTSRGVEPLLACYQRETRSRVRAAIEAGQLRASDLGHVLDMATIGEDELARYGDVDDLVANVNTPSDYARVQYRGR